MLIHLTLPVRQLATAIAFYDAVLATLSASRVQSSAHAAGYAATASSEPCLWLTPDGARAGAVGTRLALAAPTSAAVLRCHEVAMAQGAVSLSPPAAMPQLGPNAYGCVIQDPDGHQLEIIAGRGPADTRPLNDSADDGWQQEGFEHYNA